MQTKPLRKIVAVLYSIFIIAGVCIGFQYSNDSNNEYLEDLRYFNDAWTVDGSGIEFPYGQSEQTFTMHNTLPAVKNNEYLIIRAYYSTYTAYIDGHRISQSSDNTFLGRSTVAGNKELWIPLLDEYSGKDISINMKMRKEFYGASVSEAFITTRALYAASVEKDNIALIIFFAAFTVTGIIEIIIACTFAFKDTAEKQRRIFGALLYAGVFSVVSGQWIINDSRLPFILFGHIVGFSILTIISYHFMPLLFFRMQRYLYERESGIDYIVGDTIAVVSCLAMILALLGIIDWGTLIYLGQLYIIIVFLATGYYSVLDVLRKKKPNTNRLVSFVNLVFIILALISLVFYINNSLFRYIDILVFDIYLYVIAQVFLIYKRISMAIKDRQEHAITRFYAYNDELTKLGNRRKFYKTIDELKKNGLPENFTIIMVDSNRLKYYNDTFGHEAGDELIAATASFLQSCFESFSDSNICRIGGDEFAVSLVSDKEQLDEAIRLFKAKLAGFNGEYVKELSASVGYARSDEYPDASFEELQAKADEAMYADKNAFYKASGIDRRK